MAFNDVQLVNARTIIGVGRARLAGKPTAMVDRACTLALAAAMVETGWEGEGRLSSGPRNLASRLVPESLLCPNDGVANGDATSVGLFQQQTGWGTVRQRMDPGWSAAAFYVGTTSPAGWNPGLTSYAGWEGHTFEDAIYSVQKCQADLAFRYGAMQAQAEALFRAATAPEREDVLMAVTDAQWNELVAKVDGLIAVVGEVDTEEDYRAAVGSGREKAMVNRVLWLVTLVQALDEKADTLLALLGPGDPARG